MHYCTSFLPEHELTVTSSLVLLNVSGSRIISLSLAVGPIVNEFFRDMICLNWYQRRDSNPIKNANLALKGL